MLTGETGTGKELFARAIHNASPRRDYPFISVNCAAIPEALLESELFGYEPGAFTGASRSGKPGKFELANHGTLFLDEVGDMPLFLQAKLLRVIQTMEITRVGGVHPKRIDARIIAATNQDLAELVRANRFRSDLYYRLNVIPLSLPPLRSRREDVRELSRHFCAYYSRQFNKGPMELTEEALALLESYGWPGNVRELENVIEYAVNFANGPQIRPGRPAGAAFCRCEAGQDRDGSAVCDQGVSEADGAGVRCQARIWAGGAGAGCGGVGHQQGDALQDTIARLIRKSQN